METITQMSDGQRDNHVLQTFTKGLKYRKEEVPNDDPSD